MIYQKVKNYGHNILTKVGIKHAQSEYFDKEKTRTKHTTRPKNTKLIEKFNRGFKTDLTDETERKKVNSNVEHGINLIREGKNKKEKNGNSLWDSWDQYLHYRDLK